ncbi:hypothetical protein [Bergeyella sp. RCAD1439]|uniref:hypothetical protein n=1 Tax=Bergeyella anatis TaxID=3113737 RepID=UPI002E18EBA3|nr:hypothetical protein [Bergeyella sp. RCAD1439]
MNKEQLQDKYDDVFRDLKGEKMDWDFDAFLREAENLQSEVGEKPFRKRSLRWWYGVAAGLVLAVGLGVMLMLSEAGQPGMDTRLVQKRVLEHGASGIVGGEMAKVQDSLLSVQDSLVRSISSDQEAEAVMNKILPKRHRLKKTKKQHYASREPRKEKNKGYEGEFVMVNGYEIKDEKEAVEVVKYSLHLFSDKVSQTVAAANVSGGYGEDF